MNTILQAFENFIANQGKSLIMSGLAALTALLVAKFPFIVSIVSVQQLTGWETMGVAAAITALLHVIDHNYGTPAASVDATATAPATNVAASVPVPNASQTPPAK